MSIYEIGYLLAGLPDENVAASAAGVGEVVTKNGGTILSEEAPHREKLAYTMKKKMVSGSYDRYDEADFGWIKFEAASDKIDAIKKTIEVIPAVLRLLVITTVRENTYLGKHAPQIAASLTRRPIAGPEGDATAAVKSPVKAAEPATPEEMDKSIDEMVKEV